MSSDLDRITTIEVGMPGPSGAGISSAEKTDFDSRLDTLEAGAGVQVKDEGSALTTRATGINFTGAGVTASGTGVEKTVNIPGGTLTVQEEEVTVATGVTTIDFTGIDFNITEAPTGEINVSRNRPATVFLAPQVKDSGFSSITTTVTLVDSAELGPLADGISYDIECNVHMRAGPDSSGYVRAYARVAADSRTAGERTGTVGGERSITASHRKLNVVGDGVTTYTLAAWAQMDTGTGTISSSIVTGKAIPR